MSRLRRAVTALAALAVVPLAGCGPQVDGVTALTRDAHGALWGIWQGCQTEPVGASLVQDANTDTSRRVGRWVAARADHRVTWPLSRPHGGPGWAVWQPAPAQLPGGHSYTLVAWREENADVAGALTFTAADIARLTDGHALVTDPSDAGTNAHPLLVPLEELPTWACQY